MIRRAAAADAAAVADVHIRSRHAAVPSMPPPAHTDDEMREWITTVVLPTKEVWVAEPADVGVVAMMMLNGSWIDGLYVDPDWFGRGIGTRLLEHAMALRPDGLDLWVFLSNEGARRLYERRGFVAVAFTDGDNEEGAPDAHLHWPG